MSSFSQITKRMNVINKLMALSLAVIAVGTITALLTPPKLAGATNFTNGYGDISSTLPDDDYALYKNGNKVGSSLDCVIKWACTTGSYSYFGDSDSSHQYITLGNRSINDDGHSSTKYNYGHTVTLRIYSKDKGDKEIQIGIIDRGIGDALACHNTITAYYYDGVTADSFSSHTKGAAQRDNLHCNSTYSFGNFKGSYFEPRGNPDGSDGYVGTIVLAYEDKDGSNNNGQNTQTSLHIHASDGAKLGYAGEGNGVSDNDKPSEAPSSEFGYVNTYPTNFAKDHKIRYYFRPQCITPDNTPFYISWDDANIGKTSIQQTDAKARLYKFQVGHMSDKILVNTYDVLGNSSQTRTEHTDNYGPQNNQPYSYMIEFDGIDGGNGISFSHPFDSADARIECRSVKGNLTLTCTPAGYHYKIENASTNLAYRILQNGHVTPAVVGSTSSDGNTSGDANDGSIIDNRTYNLQIADDNSGFVTVDSASTGDGSGCVGKPNSGNCEQVFVNTPPKYGTTTKKDTRTAYSVTGSDGSVQVFNTLPSSYSKASKTIDYTPTSEKVTIKTITQYLGSSDGEWHNETDTSVPGYTAPYDSGSITCYHATCSIYGIDGPGPNNEVLAGQQFKIYAMLTNDVGPKGADMPEKLAGAPLVIAWGSDLYGNGSSWSEHYVQPISGGLDKGQTKAVAFTMTAPAGAGLPHWKAHGAYSGKFAFNPINPCDQEVNVYEPFNISFNNTNVLKDAAGGVNDENPATVHYTSQICNSAGVKVDVSWITNVTKDGSPPALASNSGTSAEPNCRDSITPDSRPVRTPVQISDKYCTISTASRISGYIGGRGSWDVINDGPSGTFGDDGCKTVTNKPYVHFTGGDVSAGGGFDGESQCNTPGGIHTLMNEPNSVAPNAFTPVGSGVQIGALSIGPITGFSSVNLRGSGSLPISPTGLSFSNKENISGGDSQYGSGETNHGGKLGGSKCITNYYSNLGSTAGESPANNSTNVTTTTNPDPKLNKIVKNFDNPAGGTLIINASTIANGTNEVIYVKGNVRITGNITYASNWGTIESVPSLYIIAKGGNIYIDPGVSQLDGVYVSQPNTAATPVGGSIYTCGNGTTRFDQSLIWARCHGTQLVVNGAFVSQKVYLDRSYGSLRYGSPGDRMVRGINKDCGDGNTTTLGDCAGEIFNLGPEIYLSQPAFDAKTGPTTGIFDYITSLAPVL